MTDAMPTLVIGTRGSALAQAQTNLVAAALQERRPGVPIEVRRIRTQGDRDQTSSLREIGGQGVFVREIEAALLAGEVDLAVHSLKDLPAISPPDLVLAAYLPREDPRDVLISRGDLSLAQLRPGAVVGTSSMRRRAQLLGARPDLRTEDLRGNVDTRLRKLADGAYDAIVLALAGLRRLGRENAVTEILSPDVMLPAPGQGTIAVQTRADDAATREIVSHLDDPATRAAVTAERAFLRALGSGCRAPVAAYAVLDGDDLALRGMIGMVDDDSRSVRPLVRGRTRGPVERADDLGVELAVSLAAQLRLRLNGEEGEVGS